MLEGFQPLDLSFLQSQPLDSSRLPTAAVGSVPDLKTIAQKITSGMDWSKIQANLAAAPPNPQKPTFWHGLMDLLSSGNYAVANGIQGAIDGIDNNPKDNVAGKILDAIGGGAKGALTGIGAGVTSGLSAMTGIGDAATSDYGKTRFADLIQNHTPLGIKVNPDTGQITQDGQVLSEDQAKHLMLANNLFGMTGDIFLDPTTYTGFGGLPKLSKLLNIGKDATGAVKGLEDVGKTADSLKDLKGLDKSPVAGISDLNKFPNAVSDTPQLNKLNSIPPNENLKPLLGLKDIPSAAVHEPVVPPVAPEPSSDFSSFLTAMANNGELAAAKLTPATEHPIEQIINKSTVADPAIQAKLAGKLGQIIQRAPTAESAARGVNLYLQTNHADTKFPELQKYLDVIRGTQNYKTFSSLLNYVGKDERIGAKAADLRKRVVSGIREAITKDVAATANPVNDASGIIDQVAKGVKDIAPVAAPAISKFGPAEDIIFNNVLRNYSKQISTGMYESLKGPERGFFQRALETGANVKWSGPKQVNVFQTFLHKLNATGNLKYATKSRYTKALNMLKAFEDHYMGLGHTPYSASKTAESVPLRLSDVISRIGPEAFAKNGDLATNILRASMSGGELTSSAEKAIRENPDLARTITNAIEESKARSAISEAPAIQEGMNAGKTTAEQLINENALSSSRLKDALTGAQKVAGDVAKSSGASHAGSSAASNWVRSTFDLKNPVASAIEKGKLNTLRQLSSSVDKLAVDYKYSNAPAITRAIEKTLGPIATAAKIVGPAAKVEEWLGSRFNTAYGNSDMRPIYLSSMASAKATVSLRARQVNDLVHQFGNDGDLWHEATQVAQGIKAATPQTQELATQIQKVMEDLFGGSGLRAGAELSSSVAGRSQLLRKELNQALARYGLSFSFSSSKALKTATGIKDYSKGTDWLKSWESWDVKNPLQMLYQVQNAVEMTVRTRAMFDEIISRFGKYESAPGYTARINNSVGSAFPYLAGVKFQPHMAEQANIFLKALLEVNKPNSKFLQHLDSIMAKWKSSVTIYKPSHYIRNLVGDTMFNWMAGVNGSKPYSIAIKAMKSQKGKYEWEKGNLADLTGPDALKNAILRGAAGVAGPVGSNVAFTMKNGRKITNDMLYVGAFKEGVLPSVRMMEDLGEETGLLDKIHLPGKFQGKLQETVHNIHEQRDHFIRLAHFADVVMKSPKDFEAALSDASSVVRKWHPDGMDLTKFERNTMRRAFPFYSWTRKAIPLAVETALTNPFKVMLYPRLMYGAQQSIMGPTQSRGVTDPFPIDQLWPDWMREKGIGPLWGSIGNYGIINPSTPINDLAAQFGGIPQMMGNGFSAKGVNGVSSMVNPLVKIPGEIMSGQNISSNAPITDWTQYFTSQIPGVSDLARLSNVDLGGASPKMATQGFGNTQSIVNYLTAAGYTQTDPKTAKAGQYSLKDYLKSKKG